MAIATAEAPTRNLLVISAIEIPISRLKKQAISGRTLGRIRGAVPVSFLPVIVYRCSSIQSGAML